MITKGFMEVVWHGLAANQYTPLTKATLCGYRVMGGFNPRTKVTPDPSRVNCEACIREAPEWRYVGHGGRPGTKESPKPLRTLTHYEQDPGTGNTVCGLDISGVAVVSAGIEASCPYCERIRLAHLGPADHIALPGKKPSQEPDCVHLVGPIDDDDLDSRVTIFIRHGYRVVSAQVIGEVPNRQTWVFLVRGEPK